MTSKLSEQLPSQTHCIFLLPSLTGLKLEEYEESFHYAYKYKEVQSASYVALFVLGS